jgi:hypothetical protein
MAGGVLAPAAFMIFWQSVLPSLSRLQNRVVMSMHPQPWPEMPGLTAGAS